MAARISMGFRTAWPVLAGLALAPVLALAGCDDDGGPKTMVAAPGTAATWRVVVWGAGEQRDPLIRATLEKELLRRGLAATIVSDSGKPDHVLQVTASPLVFPAQESVRDGRDSRLLEETSFHTDAPSAEAQSVAATDPTRALAITVAGRLAQDPHFAPKAPSPPAK